MMANFDVLLTLHLRLSESLFGIWPLRCFWFTVFCPVEMHMIKGTTEGAGRSTLAFTELAAADMAL